LKPDTELNKINILFVTVQPLASCYEHQAVHNRFAVSKPRTVAWCISTTTLSHGLCSAMQSPIWTVTIIP